MYLETFTNNKHLGVMSIVKLKT